MFKLIALFLTSTITLSIFFKIARVEQNLINYALLALSLIFYYLSVDSFLGLLNDKTKNER